MVPFLWVIDDFLRKPEAVRDKALSLTYSRTGYYPGRGSVEQLKIEGLEETVSSIVRQEVYSSWPPDHAHSTCRLTLAQHNEEAPIHIDPNQLNIFVAVVFASAPGVFRIVRGLAMDIKTRDYVAAAQTRGEGPWYIMLWEILPNARGPLIVDFCLRIGYTTILLGTLGFFGLGVSPDSPDWGSTIDDGRKLLNLFPHPALAPALALMSLVLGLNLLADGLREESLKD